MRLAIVGILMVAVAGCTHEMSQMGSAGGSVDITPDAAASVPEAARVPAMTQVVAYDGATLGIDARVKLLQSEVAAIDARVANGFPSNVELPLTRSETVLSRDAFADITKDRWTEMYTYTDGSALRRIRMLPLTGQATEEFYYDGGQLIAVHFEADGNLKDDPHSEAGGQMFYFGKEGMLAWIREDGSRADPSTATFQHWAQQLPVEAARFPHGQ